MPLKRPHQRARPNVNGKTPPENRAWQRRARVMHERGHLAGIDRFVRNKDIWQLKLERRHTWITPFMFGCDMQLFAQLIGANTAFVAIYTAATPKSESSRGL